MRSFFRRETLANGFFYSAIFLLPWQTRFMYASISLNGSPTEYGLLSVYVTELLLFISFLISPRSAGMALEPFFRAGSLFLAITFFSLTFSDFFLVGMGFVFHLIMAFVLFVLVQQEQISLKKTAIFFLLGLFGPILIGWYQFLSGTSPSSTLFGLAAKDALHAGVAVIESEAGRTLRAYGSFPHPNIFGGYLAAAIFFFLWLARYVQTNREIFFGCVYAILIASAFVITFSRSAFLGAALALTVLGVSMLLHKKLPSPRTVPILLVLTTTTIACSFLFSSFVWARVNTDSPIEVRSISERSTEYAFVDDLFGASWIFGVGPGAYPFALAKLAPTKPVWFYQPIHNSYLLLLTELGVLILFPLYRLMSAARSVWKSSTSAANRLFGPAFLWLFFTIAFFDHYLLSLWSGLALVALTVGFVLRSLKPS